MRSFNLWCRCSHIYCDADGRDLCYAMAYPVCVRNVINLRERASNPVAGPHVPAPGGGGAAPSPYNGPAGGAGTSSYRSTQPRSTWAVVRSGNSMANLITVPASR